MTTEGPGNSSQISGSKHGLILKILIVDDDPVMSANLAELLGFEGYAAGCVRSGREALDEIPRFMPDLILCDMRMPEMDGISILRALRQDPRTAKIPFVFMTGQNNLDAHVGALRVDGYLYKPFRIDQFMETVRSFTNGF